MDPKVPWGVPNGVPIVGTYHVGLGLCPRVCNSKYQLASLLRWEKSDLLIVIQLYFDHFWSILILFRSKIQLNCDNL